ncbi:MAG: hypothetical protein U0930_00720 [Pirellulales bacterium]
MSRRRESVAPSLFPFLAVLLCTMGALVLMLLLLVVGAQSSAKEVADKVEDELEWQQDQLQTVKNSLVKKYDEAKIEIEKKRLHLQNIEQHIHELKEELDLLEKTAKATEEKKDTQQETLKQRDAQREALEKQLAEAKKTLESKIKDPKGDKPIFAIIPYDGPNGTHRRPIYLECNAKGLIVQPEGVVLSPADLSPPYGPGNPLDAVLRTIRAEFPSRDGSLDSNPYPLLVVRPSGIKHYMMARAAMSGWDDQFGYELISEDLELSFPASAPNLQKKLASTIESARQRQAALVLSMPQHYDASQLDFYGSGGGGGAMEDVSGEFAGMSGSGSGSGQSGSASQGSSGRRGGMSMIGGGNQSGSTSSLSGNGNGSNPLSLAQSIAQSQGNKEGPGWTFGQSAANAANPPAGNALGVNSLGGNSPGTNNDLAAQSGAGQSGSTQNGSSGQMSFFGGGSSEEGYGLTGRGSASNSRVGGMGGGTIGGDSVNGDGSPGDSSTNGSKPTAGNSASATADASASGNTSLWNAAQAKANGSSSSSGGGSNSGGSAAMSSNPMAGSPMSGSNLPTGASGDPSQIPGEVQNLGMNVDMSKRSQDAKPVAQSKGRGWAWRDGNRSQTAIVRAIWLQCYKDRWIVRPDKGSNNASLTIKLEGSPMQRAERLAAAVHQRVEGWGVALAGGHWAPVIHVEVASDAEDQFKQLQKLMEGSGIDVIRKGTISPQQFK